MGNTYFSFKQFTVHQQGSAMKVCTDACIQGAFTALHIKDVPFVLDIGTGTGLLSLLLAQESNASIDAIELEPDAAEQARQNFDSSPWKERLRLIREDVRFYHPAITYPFIITNPPFYENDLKSINQQRNAAMHSVSLDYEALLDAVIHLLSPDGRFSVLLPYEGFQRFRRLAEAEGFVLQELLEIRQTPAHGYFRAVGIFGRGGDVTGQQSLTIYDDQRQYTPAFIQLLKPYYLYL